jgi:quercetin dioxygenase-like cupin family protein
MPASEYSSKAHTGLTVSVLGDTVTFKLTTEQTSGAYTIVEASNSPGGGTPPHIQHKDDEAFYVLEGTYTFRLGEETIEHGPGGHVFVPRGTVHAFQNTGDTPARMLIINSPGGIHEQFFLDVGIEVVDLSSPPEINMEDQIARVMEATPKYGIEMLPLSDE